MALFPPPKSRIFTIILFAYIWLIWLIYSADKLFMNYAFIKDQPPAHPHDVPSSSSALSSSLQYQRHQQGVSNPPIPLADITKNPEPAEISCPPPLLPIFDRIVPQHVIDQYNIQTNSTQRKIPRTIHVSMKSRCMPVDYVDAVDSWKKALPLHSVYFHDDDAVDRLMDSGWPEFPHLGLFLGCVRFKGAMKIDIWRVLVVYRYGGIYTDIDNLPGPEFSEEGPIKLTDDAFFFGDAWNRPSQWFFAMVPHHPIAFYTIFSIFSRLQVLEEVEKPNVVKVTGPEAMKHGYGEALGWSSDQIFEPGTHDCKFGYTVTKFHKLTNEKYIGHINRKELVVLNSTHTMKRGHKMAIESGVDHWLYQVKQKKTEFKGTCVDFLYMMSHGRGNVTNAFDKIL